jgi:hypothetical protein
MLQLLDLDDMKTIHTVTDSEVVDNVYFVYIGFPYDGNNLTMLGNQGIVARDFLYNGMFCQHNTRVKFCNGFLGIMVN